VPGEVSLSPLNERILKLAHLLVVPAWDFRHITRVSIRREVERILSNHGNIKTTICTPEELI
jgi:hypothetical protein